MKKREHSLLYVLYKLRARFCYFAKSLRGKRIYKVANKNNYFTVQVFIMLNLAK